MLIDTMTATVLAKYLLWVQTNHAEFTAAEIKAYLHGMATPLWFEYCGRPSA